MLRQFAGRAYWFTQKSIRALLGSTIDERRFIGRSVDDVREGFSNINDPHRAWLAKVLLADSPKSIVEVGCGWGPNLQIIAEASPTTELTGLDISPASIAEGRRKLLERKIESVSLIEAHADDLHRLPGGATDTVFTDALMLYVGPDKIKECWTELFRIANRRVVALEMHQSGVGANGYYSPDGWIRDYQALLAGVAPRQYSVSVTPLPTGIFVTGRWPLYGALIDARISNARG